MRMLARLSLLVSVCALLAPAAALAGRDHGSTVSREFAGVKRIELKTVCGDCVVKKGPAAKVTIEIMNDLEPSGAVDFEFDQDGDLLEMRERIEADHSNGHIVWTLSVPDDLEIEFSSASGDFRVSGIDGRFDGSTASGDFEFAKCSGEFKVSTASGDNRCTDCSGRFRLSTASGDCVLEDCTGSFAVSSASGDVEMRNAVTEDESNFSAASGDVEVVLAATPGHDLNVSSASGDAVLDFNGNAMRGYFELTCKRRGGKIVSPVDFDDEVEYERHGQTYVRKSFTKGEGDQEISVSTASGKAVLRK